MTTKHYVYLALAAFVLWQIWRFKKGQPTLLTWAKAKMDGGAPVLNTPAVAGMK